MGTFMLNKRIENAQDAMLKGPISTASLKNRGARVDMIYK